MDFFLWLMEFEIEKVLIFGGFEDRKSWLFSRTGKPRDTLFLLKLPFSLSF